MRFVLMVLALSLLAACDAGDVAPPPDARMSPSPSPVAEEPTRPARPRPKRCRRQEARRADEVLVSMLPVHGSPYERNAFVGRVRRLDESQVGYPIRATLGLMLNGPTKRERAAGCAGVADLTGIIRSMDLDAGVLTIDLTDDRADFSWISTSHAGAVFVGQFAATLARFPEIEEVVLQLDGSCTDLYRMMEKDCHTLLLSEWRL
jgi:hypothetical protein